MESAVQSFQKGKKKESKKVIFHVI